MRCEANVRAWYQGYRNAVAESHYLMLQLGANRKFVHPMEYALRFNNEIMGVPEDAGDHDFRRSYALESDTRGIIYKRP